MSKVFGIGTGICYNQGIIKWVKILSIGVSQLVSVPVSVPVLVLVSVLGDKKSATSIATSTFYDTRTILIIMHLLTEKDQ